MEALDIREAAPCRCGGQVKIFGPCEYAPRSHWIIYCTRNSCEQMVSADSLEEAIDLWNHLLEPVHE